MTPSGEATTSAARFPDRGGIDVFDALLVRQPVRDPDAVRACVADWAAGADDVTDLLPVAGASSATLFLDADEPALVWWVEVVDDDVAPWTDPATAIRASPLFEAGLSELVEGRAAVLADGHSGCQLVTHATHPRRTARYADHVGRDLVAPVAGDDLPVPVALVAVPLKPGVVSRLAGLATRAGNWAKRFDAVASRVRERTDALEAEAMYTESLLFEPVGDRLVLHYYMETESMDRLYEAYERHDGLEVRFSDWVMRRVFETPGKMLDPPLESDAEVLVHAVHPDRP